MTERTDKPSRNKAKKKKDQNIFDRQPPHNHEAEVGVIGSIMIKPDICDEMINILRGR